MGTDNTDDQIDVFVYDKLNCLCDIVISMSVIPEILSLISGYTQEVFIGSGWHPPSLMRIIGVAKSDSEKLN